MDAKTPLRPLPAVFTLLLALSCSSGAGAPAPGAPGAQALVFRSLTVEAPAKASLDPGAREDLAAALALPTPGEAPAPYTLILDGVRDLRAAVQLPRGRGAGLAAADGAPLGADHAEVAFDACLVGAAPGGSEQLTVGGVALEVTGRWQTLTVAAPVGVGALEFERDPEGPSTTALLLASPRRVDSATPPPTVILITSDTHRADHVSTINPGSPVSTPHIDRLGSEGAVFTNCFSSINNTNPSHVSLLTGVHPRDTKIINNHTRLHVSANTLAEQFREAGYQTYAALSAFHLFDDVSGLGQGFHRMSAPLRGAVDGRGTLARANRWLDDSAGAPLFLWVHLFDAHSPYELPDEEMLALLEGRPDPYRESADLGVEAQRIPAWLAKTELTDPEFVTALYAGEVRYLDGLLGEFLARPRVKEASIAFTADHGEALGEGDIWWDHFGLVDPTIHVPLVLRGPGITPGARSTAAVRQIDIGRTLLQMAGLGEASFPGRDVREVLSDEPAPEPRYAMSGQGISASIELEGWLLELYLRNVTDSDSTPDHRLGEVTLFNLRADPRCANNLLLDEFPRATRMRSALIQWLEAARSTGMTYENQEVSPTVQAKLAELGYTGGLESIYRWWTPERRDKNWLSSPWQLAFEGSSPGQGRKLLSSELKRVSGDR